MSRRRNKTPRKTKPSIQNYDFYAVANGRKRGIFTVWEDCERSVYRYPNQRYKGHCNLDSAICWLNEMNIKTDDIAVYTREESGDKDSVSADSPVSSRSNLSIMNLADYQQKFTGLSGSSGDQTCCGDSGSTDVLNETAIGNNDNANTCSVPSMDCDFSVHDDDAKDYKCQQCDYKGCPGGACQGNSRVSRRSFSLPRNFHVNLSPSPTLSPNMDKRQSGLWNLASPPQLLPKTSQFLTKNDVVSKSEFDKLKEELQKLSENNQGQVLTENDVVSRTEFLQLKDELYKLVDNTRSEQDKSLTIQNDVVSNAEFSKVKDELHKMQDRLVSFINNSKKSQTSTPANQHQNKDIDRLNEKINELKKSEMCKDSTILKYSELANTKDQTIASLQQSCALQQKNIDKLSNELLYWKTNAQIVNVDNFEHQKSDKKSPAQKQPSSSIETQSVPVEPKNVVNVSTPIHQTIPSTPISTPTRTTSLRTTGAPDRMSSRPPSSISLSDTRESTSLNNDQYEDVDLLVIGTSNVNGLDPKLMYKYKKCVVETLQNKTIEGAKNFVIATKFRPKVTVLHVAGNSLTSNSAEKCATDMYDLILLCKETFGSNAKILISEVTPRTSPWGFTSKMERFNSLMREIMSNDKFVIPHPTLQDPRDKNYRDGIHYSAKYGVKELVKDIKRYCNGFLGLTEYTEYTERPKPKFNQEESKSNYTSNVHNELNPYSYSLYNQMPYNPHINPNVHYDEFKHNPYSLYDKYQFSPMSRRLRDSTPDNFWRDIPGMRNALPPY